MRYDYDFIDDLIPLILDASEHWWQCHLAALATVSHTWLYNVRKRLYACPDIRTFGALQKLADTVEANEYLATLVRGLSLQPLISNSPEPVWRGMGGARRGLGILLGLEGLKKITFGGDMGMKADRYIGFIGNPEAVEEMHLSGSRQLIWPRVVTWDEILTFGFPRLKKIRLSEVDVDVSVPTVEYPASFTELILEDVHIMYGRLAQLLNGAKWLRCLHVTVGSYGLVDEEQLREVLASCAVECLHYEVGKSSVRWNPFSGLGEESGRGVRCLHLEGHLMDVGILDTLGVVFRNVEELVVGGRLVSVTAGEWAGFVAGGALPSLRRLGLPWGTKTPPFARWTAAETEQIRAASFSYTTTYIMFPRKSSSVMSLRREKEKAATGSSAPSAYNPPVVFPVLHPQHIVPPATYSTRTRSRTGPSKWDPGLPQLRFSNSSSTQNTDTPPPRTPDDYHSSYDSFDHFSVVVAAPVSGVETMDALVDGMNGGDIITPRSSARHGLGPIPNHHPLYQPPLPTPPPGIVLGSAKTRKPPKKSLSPDSTDDDDDDDYYTLASSRSRRRRQRPSSSRTASNSTITASSYSNFTHQDSDHDSLHSHSHRRTTSKDMHRHVLTHSRRPSGSDSPTLYPERFGQLTSKDPARPHTSSSVENRKAFVPSISEIVRNFAPPSVHTTRPCVARSSSLYTPSSHGHSIVLDDPESEPEIQTRAGTSAGVEEEAEAEFLSRSSIDSVADEVQRTIRNQNQIRPQPRSLPPPTPTTTFKSRYSIISDNASSIYSPRSDPGATPSVYSFSAPSSYFASSPLDSTFLNMTKTTASQAVAQYLRSTRLTRLLRLTRSPHASADNPLTVSLSDLGSANGFPVVVFLGLGCVRHIMGLYDEMAQCMGLRLITIDRWGLGRTEPRSKSAKGIIQWAAAVEEVLDLLRIEKCSVMAHSAGAPYALSFANRVASRIRGDICLLAPWVGGSENNGYKWLKYVPNSILKTAQAAEWKIQAWMIGKPPTLTYEGIGYTLPVVSKQTSARSSPVPNGNLNVVYPPAGESRPRPSIGSSSLSEYDDLRDFEGQFGSRSTLALPPPGKPQDGGVHFKRKPSKGIFERLKGSPSSSSQNQEKEKEKSTSTASSSTRKLRALTSMGSLKNRGQGHASRKSEPSSPQLPPALRIDVGLGLEDLSWVHKIPVQPDDHTPRVVSNGSWGSGSGSGSVSNPRSSGRRSISFTSSVNGASLGPPPSPPASVFSSSPGPVTCGPSVSSVALQSEANFQAQLGNALIAASHAESSKGTTNDLLQILNHENHSWGFSYANYPHRVRVWYGDKDEKIAENAVRWMEKTMGPDRCSVKVVKGADHGLMYRSSAVVDVLEWIQSAWRDDRPMLLFSEFRRR